MLIWSKDFFVIVFINSCAALIFLCKLKKCDVFKDYLNVQKNSIYFK